MRNIRLTIEYEGTNYSGWQVQNSRQKAEDRRQKKTIQEALEQTLAQILQQKIKVIGSGRTDAGVHALGQVANFKTNSNLSCSNLQRGLNSILAKDIRIKKVGNVQSGFHARFLARSKLYRYTIVNHSFSSPFVRNYAYLVKYPLDVNKMRQGARFLLGRHNFRSFQAVDKVDRDPVRKILRLNVRMDKQLIYFEIRANGFLYKMVRNIVGTLIDVGRGKLEPQDIKRILQAKNRIYAGPCAPAKGLCLIQVAYER